MDAFEQIISRLLWQEGIWTTVGYKVNLPKEKKKVLGKPTMPRPEIDILGYQASENLLLWVECKSYLDSRGVIYQSLSGEDKRGAMRFKVFTQPKYRKIVTEELISQVVKSNLTRPNPAIQYCLVTGKIATDVDRYKLHYLFSENDWILFDEFWVKQGLERLSEIGYEDDIATIVTKIYARN